MQLFILSSIQKRPMAYLCSAIVVECNEPHSLRPFDCMSDSLCYEPILLKQVETAYSLSIFSRKLKYMLILLVYEHSFLLFTLITLYLFCLLFLPFSHSSTSSSLFLSCLFYLSPLSSSISVSAAVSASDCDSEQNADITYYTLSSDFIISPHGTIFPAGALDYERPNHLYEFVVMAVDKGEVPRTGTATVRLRMANVNDEPPEFSQPV